MKVSLEFDLQYAGEEGIEGAILMAAGNQLLASVRSDIDGRMELGSRIRAIRDEEIRAVLVPLIQDTLSASIVPTNSWGEPQGQPTTLREIIVAQAANYMTTAKSDQYGNRNRETPVEAFIRAEIASMVDRELKSALAEGKAKLMTVLREKGAALLAEQIRELAEPR